LKGLLAELRHAGLTVLLDGDRLFVSPRDRLTEDLRQRIRAEKGELLAAVRLDGRVRAMATRWGYTPEELAEALAAASSDPAGWLLWTEKDERDFGDCVTSVEFAAAYRAKRGLA